MIDATVITQDNFLFSDELKLSSTKYSVSKQTESIAVELPDSHFPANIPTPEFSPKKAAINPIGLTITATPELIDSKLIFSNITEQKRQIVVEETKKSENHLDSALQNFDKNANINGTESISVTWVDFFLDTSSSEQEININSLGSLQFDGAKSDTKAAVVNSPSSFELVSSQLKPQLPQPDDFKTFPVGVMVGQRNARASVLVRGEEDGAKAIEFDRWLLPYDVVINALGLNVKNLTSEQVELSSPGIITRINISELKKDPKLGLVFSVQDLQKYFGVNADFDIKEYAIRLNVPWSEYNHRPTVDEKPLILEGLPRFEAPTIGVSSISQQVTLTGSDSQPTKARGDLNVIGTAFGGSWFLRANQFDLRSTQTWNLAEAQFLRQTDTADYIVGSQMPFWSNQGGRGDYWGFSTIQRHGFSSPNGVSNTLPQQRMQAAQLGRTISGRAAPGTLVRLVQNFTNRAVAEVLVDSDGIYEFEDVLVDGQITTTNYRLFLYPQGKLTAQPSIREVTFNNVPGQLPKGTSALIVSGGLRREYNNDFIGQFTNLVGGVEGRWGVSEHLTLGLGTVYEGSVKGLGEVFWHPQNFPLSVAVSALTPGITGGEDKGWVFNSDISYQPSTNFQARFSSDYYRNRFNLDWRVIPGINLFGILDSNNPAAIGAQFIRSNGNNFTFARLSVNTANNWRWNFMQRLGKLELLSDGSEIGSSSELAYNFSPNNYTYTGHALLLGYQTRFDSNSNSMLSLNWRYRSQAQTNNGNPLWETQLGYGINSNGSGILASARTSILPGLSLQARYQGVSLTSDESSFSLEFLPNFNLQGGLWDSNNNNNNRLRTQGGLLIQGFFDKNGNGKYDSGEKIYGKNLDLLVNLNNKPLKTAQPEKVGDRTWVRLSPGQYRLDFDPAGFPVDWQVSTPAYAVDVVAGSFTRVMIPLVPAYTLSGVYKDAQGKVVSGARVEAINLQSGQRYWSITNSGGVYYLEYLSQGNYQLQIDGQLSQPQTVTFKGVSQNMQKLDLQAQAKEILGQSQEQLKN